MTPEQQKALAIARARRRRAEAGQQTPQPESEPALAARQDMGKLFQDFDTANGTRAQFDALPTWKKPLVAAVDLADIASQGFGFRDKAVAAARAPFTDQTYAQELESQRNMSQAARDRAGTAAIAADVAAPAAIARTGLTMFGKGADFLTRSSLAALEGAGYGGLAALGNDTDLAEGLAIGGIGGVGGNALGEFATGAVSKIAGLFGAKPKIPSIDDLNAAKKAAYEQADQAGVAFAPEAVERINQNVTATLTDMGFDPALQPGAAAALRRIQELQGQNVTLKGLDTIRKVASNGYIPGNKSNNMAIGQIIDAIDDVVDNPQAADILMGNAQLAGGALKEARGLASRTAKLERVEDAVSRADLRAASTGSGGNADNATRQNLRKLLEKPRGFTSDERAALEAVVRGTGGQNALRLAGKLSPSGNGLMAALGVGGAMVNPMIGAASLAGMGSKAFADRMTQANVKKLAEIIAAGGSRAATQVPKNSVQRLTEAKHEAIARFLAQIGAVGAVAP